MKLVNWFKDTFGKRPSIKEALDDFWAHLEKDDTETALQRRVKQYYDGECLKEAEELADKLFGGKIR